MPPEPLLVARVGILTVSEANQRDAWQAHHRRSKRQREQTRAALVEESDESAGRRLLARHGRLWVHLERLGAHALDDDNLAGALKAVRDEVAAWLGCDDSPRGPVRWTRGQQAGKRWAKCPWVVVEIRTEGT